MTLIRRAALRLAEFVARHASAGSREWAEGLAREVEFIDGDWNALGWAVSSLPVLLDRRAAPLRSLQDVPALAQKLSAASHAMDGTPDWIGAVPPALWAATMGARLLHTNIYTERVGYGLAMCGWILAGVAMYLVRSRRKERPASPPGDWTLFYPGDLMEWALYYKSELEFHVERQRSPLIWLHMFAVLLVFAGLSIGYGSFFAVVLMPLGLSTVPLIFYSRNKTQLRLDQLNALLAASREHER